MQIAASDAVSLREKPERKQVLLLPLAPPILDRHQASAHKPPCVISFRCSQEPACLPSPPPSPPPRLWDTLHTHTHPSLHAREVCLTINDGQSLPPLRVFNVCSPPLPPLLLLVTFSWTSRLCALGSVVCLVFLLLPSPIRCVRVCVCVSVLPCLGELSSLCGPRTLPPPAS